MSHRYSLKQLRWGGGGAPKILLRPAGDCRFVATEECIMHLWGII